MAFLGIKFPFRDDTVSGKLFKTDGNSFDDIRSSLHFFITTRKGERWYDPDFGTRLYEFLFEVNDEITANQVTASLKEDIEKYFKQIVIQDIRFDQSESNVLSIIVEFIFSNTPLTVAVAVSQNQNTNPN